MEKYYLSTDKYPSIVGEKWTRQGDGLYKDERGRVMTEQMIKWEIAHGYLVPYISKVTYNTVDGGPVIRERYYMDKWEKGTKDNVVLMKELTMVINKYGWDTKLDMPDYIVAKLLHDFLQGINRAQWKSKNCLHPTYTVGIDPYYE